MGGTTTRVGMGLVAAGLLLAFVHGALGALVLVLGLVALALGREEFADDHLLIVMATLPVALLGFFAYSFPDAIAGMLVGLFTPFTTQASRQADMADWAVRFVALGFAALHVGLAAIVWDRMEAHGKPVLVLGALFALIPLPVLLANGYASDAGWQAFQDATMTGRATFPDLQRLLLLVGAVGAKVALILGYLWALAVPPGASRTVGAHLA